MKKILLTSIAVAGYGVATFGQPFLVQFDNYDNSSVPGITLVSSSGPKTGSGLVVELLWDNGSSYVLEDTFTSTFTGNSGNGQGPGYFAAGLVSIPKSGVQTFEVEAFYTGGSILYTGTTASFTAKVDPPPLPPLGIDNGTPPAGWDGNLVLEAVPEPGTIALGGLGTAVLMLFRRRSNS